MSIIKTVFKVFLGTILIVPISNAVTASDVKDLNKGTIAFSCRCGKVRGTAAIGPRQLRIACHCADCRKWGLLPIAGGGAALDPQGDGGLDMVLVYKGGIKLDAGSLQHVAVKRLYDESRPRRYTATCCDTSVGVAMPSPFCLFGLSVVPGVTPADPEGVLSGPRVHILLTEREKQEAAQLFSGKDDVVDLNLSVFGEKYFAMSWYGILNLSKSPFPEQSSPDQVLFPRIQNE